MVAATLLAVDAVGGEREAARARLEALHYDLEVAGYCGLVDGDVGAGFRAAAAPLVEASELDREGLDALRGRAWQAAHAEWQNRGLGGFRAWRQRGPARRRAPSVASFRHQARKPPSPRFCHSA